MSGEALAGLAQGFASGLEQLPQQVQRGREMNAQKEQADKAYGLEKQKADYAQDPNNPQNKLVSLQGQQLQQEMDPNSVLGQSRTLDNKLKETQLVLGDLQGASLRIRNLADEAALTTDPIAKDLALQKMRAEIESLGAQTKNEAERISLARTSQAQEQEYRNRTFATGEKQFGLTYAQNERKIDLEGKSLAEQTRAREEASAQRKREFDITTSLERAKIAAGNDNAMLDFVGRMSMMRAQSADDFAKNFVGLLSSTGQLRTGPDGLPDPEQEAAIRQHADAIANSPLPGFLQDVMTKLGEAKTPDDIRAVQRAMRASDGVISGVLEQAMRDGTEPKTLQSQLSSAIDGVRSAFGGLFGASKPAAPQKKTLGKSNAPAPVPAAPPAQLPKYKPSVDQTERQKQFAMTNTLQRALSTAQDDKERALLQSVNGQGDPETVRRLLREKQYGHWYVSDAGQVVRMPWADEIRAEFAKDKTIWTGVKSAFTKVSGAYGGTADSIATKTINRLANGGYENAYKAQVANGTIPSYLDPFDQNTVRAVTKNAIIESANIKDEDKMNWFERMTR